MLSQTFEMKMNCFLEEEKADSGHNLIVRDGPNLRFQFPAMPCKIPQSDMGTSPPVVFEGNVSSEKVVQASLPDAAVGLLKGGNTVVASYGADTRGRIEKMIGDGGVARVVIQQLFEQPATKQEHVQMRAYSYQPRGDRLHDLSGDAPSDDVQLVDAEGRFGGCHLEGLHKVEVRDRSDALRLLGQMKKNANMLLEKVNEDASRRADEIRKHAEATQASAREVQETGELDMAPAAMEEGAMKAGRASPAPGSKMDLSKVKVEPFLPGVYEDCMIVVELWVSESAESDPSDRHSNTWAVASFVVLPDCRRPQMPGILDVDDTARYESVQKFNTNVLLLLNALRLKRNRVPYNSMRMISTFRFWYRQSLEREKAGDIMKRTSIRKRQTDEHSPDGSPRAVGHLAPPTHTVLLFDLARYGSPSECFHRFTCARRLVVHGSWAGRMTRHLQCEQAQMAGEVGGLSVQLEVARIVHNYQVQLYGVEKKGKIEKNADGDPLTVRQREDALITKAREAKAERDRERSDRIRESAEAVAKGHIQTVRSAIDELEREEQDLKAMNETKRGEIRMWKNKDMSELNAELDSAKREAQQAEARKQALEAEMGDVSKKLQKQRDVVAAKRTELEAQQRKAAEEKEKRIEERRAWAAQQQKLQEDSIRDVRSRIDQCDGELKEVAGEYLQQLKVRAQGSHNPVQHRVEELISSVEDLSGLLGQLMPAAPTPEHTKRLDAARRRVLAGLAHEVVSLRKSNAAAGLPPCTYPSTRGCGAVPWDVAQPVVKVHISLEGMAGMPAKSGRWYSFSAMRNGRVHETPRRHTNEDGVVKWAHTMRFLTRLPPPGEQGMDLITCAVTEFISDGSVNESLPFDVDLLSLACRPPGQVVLLPLASGEGGAKVRVSAHVKTTKTRPKILSPPVANPLRPLSQLWAESSTFSRVGCDGDSSGDEGPASHVDPMRR